MAIERQKVMVGQLSLGMYVAELDRPWLETPFKLQGFMLKNKEQIIELAAMCQFVYIDIEKGIESPAVIERSSVVIKNTSAKTPHIVAPAIYSYTRYQKTSGTYHKQADFYKSAKQVKRVQSAAQKTLKAVDDCLERGEVFDEKPVKQVAGDIVRCVIDNPDVMSWLSRVHESDSFTHDHSVRSATWACVFARFLGVSRQDMAVLVQAVLLKNVGKTRLPNHLIVKNEGDLSHDETQLYQKYVSLTVALLKQVKGLDVKVVSIIQAHRENYDGSGFPNGLTGDDIPLLSIITHISSFYDLLINPRDESRQCSPSEAMRALHLSKNIQFQEDLVVDFNQALGVFPAGSIVEMNTGALAIVLEQNEQRKLRPIISVMTDSGLMPLRKAKKINLLTQARAPISEEAGGADSSLPELYIVRDIPVNECSVDLMALKKSIFSEKRSVFSMLSGS